MVKQGVKTQASGFLFCPNQGCNAKLGQFSHSGLKCNCGQSVMPAYQIFKSKVKATHNQVSYKNRNNDPNQKLLQGKQANSQMSHTFYNGNSYQPNGPYVDPFLASAINYNKQRSKAEVI